MQLMGQGCESRSWKTRAPAEAFRRQPAPMTSATTSKTKPEPKKKIAICIGLADCSQHISLPGKIVRKYSGEVDDHGAFRGLPALR